MNDRQSEKALQDLIDGTLDAGEGSALLRLILSEPELLERYCEYAELESALQRMTSSQGLLWEEQACITAGNRRLTQRRSLRLTVLAAVAMLVLLAVILRLTIVAEHPATLTLRLSPGTICDVSHLSEGENQPDPGTLELGSRAVIAQGSAELCFSNGVLAVVRAPADLTLHDEDHLYLDRGVAWCRVPPAAVGFRVQTPQLTATDLGTEFGVRALSHGADEIHVFKGKVEVRARSGVAATETLGAGMACAAGPIGRLTRIDSESAHFLTKLPSSLPHLHWSFDQDEATRIPAGGSHPAAGREGSVLLGGESSAAFATIQGRFGRAILATDPIAEAGTKWAGIQGNAPRTIAHWIKLPANPIGSQPIVGWGSHDLSPFNWNPAFLTYLRKKQQGTVAGVSFGACYLDGSTPVDDNRWHHFAVVYSGHSLPEGEPELTCYLDGRREPMVRLFRTDLLSRAGYPEDALAINTATSNPGAIPLTLFARHWCGDQRPANMSLALDELHVFEAALGEGQIISLYQDNQIDH